MINKRKQLDRVVKFIIVPSLLVTFIFSFIIQEFSGAFILYTVMGLWSLFFYRQKKYQEEIYGIKRGLFGEFKVFFIGMLVGGAFLVLSFINPAFSLLTPTLSLALTDDMRFMIIVFLAPLMEETWRSSVIGFLRDTYNIHIKKFWKVNLVQGIAFALMHLLAYGVFLGGYDRWIEAYGATLAISGSLISAFLFGIVSGGMMEKFQSIMPSIGAHMAINFWLVKEGLVVVA